MHMRLAISWDPWGSDDEIEFKTKCACYILQFTQRVFGRCHTTKHTCMVFECSRSRFCIELVVSLQSWLESVSVSKCQSHGRSLRMKCSVCEEIYLCGLRFIISMLTACGVLAY